MPTDEVSRGLRDRVRHLPPPGQPPPGRLEQVAWLLLHRAVPFDPAVQAHLAQQWGLPVPVAHGSGPRLRGLSTPATTGRASAGLDRVRALAASCTPPVVLRRAVGLAANAPGLSEAELQQALVETGLSDGEAGAPLLRALAHLWKLDATQPVAWPAAEEQPRLALLAQQVRRCGVLPRPDTLPAAEAGWLREHGGVEWVAGHLVARQDGASVMARPVRRQLAVLGELPVLSLTLGAHRVVAARGLTGAGLRAWATRQADLSLQGDRLLLVDGVQRWLLPTDPVVFALFETSGEVRRRQIIEVLLETGLTRGSASQWLLRCPWLRPTGRHGRYISAT